MSKNASQIFIFDTVGATTVVDAYEGISSNNFSSFQHLLFVIVPLFKVSLSTNNALPLSVSTIVWKLVSKTCCNIVVIKFHRNPNKSASIQIQKNANTKVQKSGKIVNCKTFMFYISLFVCCANSIKLQFSSFTPFCLLIFPLYCI